MSDDRRLDPAQLTPLSREVLKARDEILAVLSGLSDTRKAAMALTYAAASFVDTLAQESGRPSDACTVTLASEIDRTVRERAMTWPVAW